MRTVAAVSCEEEPLGILPGMQRVEVVASVASAAVGAY
jgi:hypothetical protein